jgi:hypothetical protein
MLFLLGDPWPIVALKDVPGAVEVIRGGDVIAYLGYNVALRSWVAKMVRRSRSFWQQYPKLISGCVQILKPLHRLQRDGFQV